MIIIIKNCNSFYLSHKLDALYLQWKSTETDRARLSPQQTGTSKKALGQNTTKRAGRQIDSTNYHRASRYKMKQKNGSTMIRIMVYVRVLTLL